MKDGFNFRNVDQLARKRTDTDPLPKGEESSRVSQDGKEKAGTDHIEVV